MAVPTGRCPHCGAQSDGEVPGYYVRKQRLVTTYRKVLGLLWIPVSTRRETRRD